MGEGERDAVALARSMHNLARRTSSGHSSGIPLLPATLNFVTQSRLRDSTSHFYQRRGNSTCHARCTYLEHGFFNPSAATRPQLREDRVGWGKLLIWIMSVSRFLNKPLLESMNIKKSQEYRADSFFVTGSLSNADGHWLYGEQSCADVERFQMRGQGRKH